MNRLFDINYHNVTELPNIDGNSVQINNSLSGRSNQILRKQLNEKFSRDFLQLKIEDCDNIKKRMGFTEAGHKDESCKFKIDNYEQDYGVIEVESTIKQDLAEVHTIEQELSSLIKKCYTLSDFGSN